MNSENPIERATPVPEDLAGRPRRVATGGVSWRRTFSAFRHRNYRLCFEAGAVAHYFGTAATLAVGALVCAFAAGVTLVIGWRRDAQVAVRK